MSGLYVTLLLAGVAPALALCGEPNRSWDVLIGSLEPGNTVVVTRMTSAKIEGKLLGITADDITVKWHGQPKVLQRDDVYRVRIANIRRRNTLSVMAAAGGIGAVAGAIAAKSGNINPGAGALIMGGIGSGIGAAFGGALPIGKPLYEAERVRRAPRPAAE